MDCVRNGRNGRTSRPTAAAVAVVLAATLWPSAPPARAAEPSRIAVIGDSYTTGSGLRSWPEIAWDLLAQEGVEVAPDVAAEGGAGYGAPGHRGNVFIDLTAQAVRRGDELVVFFGSRNDEPVDPAALPQRAAAAFQLARLAAPGAKLLVIGPPWPSAEPPAAVLSVRDTLRDEAEAAAATFVDPIAEGWFVGHPDLIGPDGVHPTDAGHVFLAAKIAPLIYRQLAVRV